MNDHEHVITGDEVLTIEDAADAVGYPSPVTSIKPSDEGSSAQRSYRGTSASARRGSSSLSRVSGVAGRPS